MAPIYQTKKSNNEQIWNEKDNFNGNFSTNFNTNYYTNYNKNEENNSKYYQTNQLTSINRQNYNNNTNNSYNNIGYSNKEFKNYHFNNNINRFNHLFEQQHDSDFGNEMPIKKHKKFNVNNTNWRINYREINNNNNNDICIKSNFNSIKGSLTHNLFGSNHFINNNELQPLSTQSSRFNNSNSGSPLSTLLQRKIDYNSHNNNYYSNLSTASMPYTSSSTVSTSAINNKILLQRSNYAVNEYGNNKNRRFLQSQTSIHSAQSYRNKIPINNEHLTSIAASPIISNSNIDSNLQKTTQNQQKSSEFNFVEIEFPLLGNEKKRHHELALTNEQQPCKKMATNIIGKNKDNLILLTKSSLISAENNNLSTTKPKDKLKKIQFSAVVAGTYNREQINTIYEHTSTDVDELNCVNNNDNNKLPTNLKKCSYAQTLKKSNC